MKPEILVTGGAGFIGSHLVERLLREGNKVTVIDDCSTGRAENLNAVHNHPALDFITAKISECPGLDTLVGRMNYVFHLAAAVGVELVVNSPIHTIKNNLDETAVILEAASRAGVPLLLASTSEVYGKSTREAFAEADDLLIGPPTLGRWSYACSKLMDEFLALAYSREKNLSVAIVRLFNTVGPRQTGRYGMVLPRFIEAARKGSPLVVYGDGRQTRCFCYVADTVEALVRVQNSPASRGEIFNIGSTEEISIEALARQVIQQLGSSSTIEFKSYQEAYAAGFQDMLRRKPVMDKLLAATGFKPRTSLKDIISATAASITV